MFRSAATNFGLLYGIAITCYAEGDLLFGRSVPPAIERSRLTHLRRGMDFSIRERCSTRRAQQAEVRTEAQLVQASSLRGLRERGHLQRSDHGSTRQRGSSGACAHALDVPGCVPFSGQSRRSCRTPLGRHKWSERGQEQSTGLTIPAAGGPATRSRIRRFAGGRCKKGGR